jgi:hypothetical protein
MTHLILFVYRFFNTIIILRLVRPSTVYNFFMRTLSGARDFFQPLMERGRGSRPKNIV